MQDLLKDRLEQSGMEWSERSEWSEWNGTECLYKLIFLACIVSLI